MKDVVFLFSLCLSAFAQQSPFYNSADSPAVNQTKKAPVEVKKDETKPAAVSSPSSTAFEEVVLAATTSAPVSIWLLREQKLSPNAASWEEKYGYRVYPIGMRPGPFHPLLPALLKRIFGTNVPFGSLDAEGTILEIAMIPKRGNRFAAIVRKGVRISTLTMGMRNDHERFFNTEIAPILAEYNAKLYSNDPTVSTSIASLTKLATEAGTRMDTIQLDRLRENLDRMVSDDAPQVSERTPKKEKR